MDSPMTTAVLLSCHGTVSRTEDIPAFLDNIRRGRPTPPELVAEVAHRFERIGGSPLMTITAAQARALEARLGIPVAFAGRLWHPYPKEVLSGLVASGVRTVLSLPLAPQSVEVYHAAVREAAAAFPELTLRAVPAWGMEPALLEAFVGTIEETLTKAPQGTREALPIVLSAHSLPRRVIAAGDLYEVQFREMANAVAELLAKSGRKNPVEIAFQSQGASAEPWLGPDLAETFAELAKAGAPGVLVAAIGFLAEHVETLYDLDIEAPKIAEKAGLSLFLRAPAVCDRPRFVDALEAVARRALEA
jgi:protoporphyrin/coproporphyrin ferrochelatase